MKCHYPSYCLPFHLVVLIDFLALSLLHTAMFQITSIDYFNCPSPTADLYLILTTMACPQLPKRDCKFSVTREKINSKSLRIFRHVSRTVSGESLEPALSDIILFGRTLSFTKNSNGAFCFVISFIRTVVNILCHFYKFCIYYRCCGCLLWSSTEDVLFR